MRILSNFYALGKEKEVHIFSHFALNDYLSSHCVMIQITFNSNNVSLNEKERQGLKLLDHFSKKCE